MCLCRNHHCRRCLCRRCHCPSRCQCCRTSEAVLGCIASGPACRFRYTRPSSWNKHKCRPIHCLATCRSHRKPAAEVRCIVSGQAYRCRRTSRSCCRRRCMPCRCFARHRWDRRTGVEAPCTASDRAHRRQYRWWSCCHRRTGREYLWPARHPRSCMSVTADPSIVCCRECKRPCTNRSHCHKDWYTSSRCPATSPLHHTSEAAKPCIAFALGNRRLRTSLRNIQTGKRYPCFATRP